VLVSSSVKIEIRKFSGCIYFCCRTSCALCYNLTQNRCNIVRNAALKSMRNMWPDC